MGPASPPGRLSRPPYAPELLDWTDVSPMERSHETMMTPPIEGLLDRVDSKFGLVTLAARRARNINAYFNQLGEGLGQMVPPQVSSVSRKPLSIGFEEIAADKIVWAEPKPVEEDEATSDDESSDDEPA